jgi:hypothetical protein
MKTVCGKIWLAAIVLTFPIAALSQSPGAGEKTREIVHEIIEKSFPELTSAEIEIRTFRSRSNYFKSQFSISRFFAFQTLHYVIFVNPEVFRRQAPAGGIRAILAHELAHVLYYKRKNRFALLGLARLAGKRFTAKFERQADLETIARGYGEGLKSYRQWLYENIPAAAAKAKMRDYFSPEEIGLMLQILAEKPETIDVWRKRVPRNLMEISKSVADRRQ